MAQHLHLAASVSKSKHLSVRAFFSHSGKEARFPAPNCCKRRSFLKTLLLFSEIHRSQKSGHLAPTANLDRV